MVKRQLGKYQCKKCGSLYHSQTIKNHYCSESQLKMKEVLYKTPNRLKGVNGY